jgi:hypothetical protein
MPCVAREVTSTHIAPERAPDHHGGGRGCGHQRPWLACLFGVVVLSVTGFLSHGHTNRKSPNKKKVVNMTLCMTWGLETP